MLTKAQYLKLWNMLEAVDAEISVFNESGFPTSPITDALDEVYEYVAYLSRMTDQERQDLLRPHFEAKHSAREEG